MYVDDVSTTDFRLLFLESKVSKQNDVIKPLTWGVYFYTYSTGYSSDVQLMVIKHDSLCNGPCLIICT